MTYNLQISKGGKKTLLEQKWRPRKIMENLLTFRVLPFFKEEVRGKDREARKWWSGCERKIWYMISSDMWEVSLAVVLQYVIDTHLDEVWHRA